MRKKIIVGNWKMNCLTNELKQLIDLFNENLVDIGDVDIAICPTFVYLNYANKLLESSNIKLGAQNVHYEKQGAYTGEISINMLEDVNVDYCIIGHSERRKYFNETDEDINLKLRNILSTSIIPIVCVGENIEDRKNGKYLDFVKKQVVQAFQKVSKEDAIRCIIAYEPIWAIGTGVTATSYEAEEMCKYIRNIILDLYDNDVANKIRIQYGGSVNGKNAKEILSMENVDGALVGGASLKTEFIDIVKSVCIK